MSRVILLVRLLGSVLPKSIPLSTILCLEGGQHWGAEKALALQSEALPLVSVWPLVISLLYASVTSPAMWEQSFPPCRLPRVRGSINTCCSALIVSPFLLHELPCPLFKVGTERKGRWRVAGKGGPKLSPVTSFQMLYSPMGKHGLKYLNTNSTNIKII